MKKYQKIFIGAILIFFIFGLGTVKTAKAITIEEIKTQINVVLAKIAEIQKQLNELIKNEAENIPKSISLISPNGREKWEVGKTYDIKWNSSGYDANAKARIELLDERYEQSSLDSKIIITKVANSGNYEWKIPDALNRRQVYGSLYKIAVYIGEENDKKSDSSDDYFFITNPAVLTHLDIISPNGGEVLQAGKDYTIKWDSSGMENYKTNIVLKNFDLAYLNIANEIPNKGYYSWKIPQNLLGSQYKISINIYDNYGNLIALDSSNNNFTIIQPSAKLDILKTQLSSILDSLIKLLK